jgi:hypothetical protein
MTAAGQSALNLPGLDTVVIYDARYGNVVDRGRNVLHRMHLGPNEILQMAGRVHGRVPNGEVTILSDRDLEFDTLRPVPPEFQLAGDAERVALTCAALGVDATDLDLPVRLDRAAYRRALQTLTERHLVEQGKLTPYGRQVDALPVERPWGELLVHAEADLTPVVAVCASVESLHRMTREERELHGVLVSGSDHLTAYNLYAEAVNQHGRSGEVYGLPRHLFEEAISGWAERRGVLLKAIEDAALGLASIYRSLELPLPVSLPYASKEVRRRWGDLVARIMPFDLVIDEQTADGHPARVSKSSVAGSWGAVAGTLRYFADRFGIPRAGIEGTTLSYDLVRSHARWGPPVVQLAGHGRRQGLAVARRLAYSGFELETDVELLGGTIPLDLRPAARQALADALLAGETRHPAQGTLSRAIGAARELLRRSAGQLEALADPALHERLLVQLEGVDSWSRFLATPLALDLSGLVGADQRRRLEALPSMVRLRGDAVPIEYEVDRGQGIARVWLREGQARRLTEDELPELDRPLRFGVRRNDDQVIRADTLRDLTRQLREPVRTGKVRQVERTRRGGRRAGPRRRRD